MGKKEEGVKEGVMLCRYNLYDFCHYYSTTAQTPSVTDCDRCMKAFRLRYGLRNIVEARGTRTGITL